MDLHSTLHTIAKYDVCVDEDVLMEYTLDVHPSNRRQVTTTGILLCFRGIQRNVRDG